MSRLQPFGFVGTDCAADPDINESSLYSRLTLFNLLLAPLHYYYYHRRRRRCRTAPKYHANTITLNRYELGNARCCTTRVIIVISLFVSFSPTVRVKTTDIGVRGILMEAVGIRLRTPH